MANKTLDALIENQDRDRLSNTRCGTCNS